ncbi:hypothetical protein ABZ819_34240 [Streptomyces venezuelae]|uniref:hypothetical protein n=1 Tax=Streptomyces venezuelae TaxID=54571 RepID=UPI00344993D8
MSDFAWVDVELVPRPVLHGAQDGLSERGVVYFGRPFTTAFDPASASETIRAYAVEHEDVADFRRLVLPLNMTPRPGEPLTSVAVQGVAQQADGRTLFWDPVPCRLTDSGTRDSRVSVTADFGLVQSQAETAVQRQTQASFLRARGAGTGIVQWEFTRRSGGELDGIYELIATVELPRGASGAVLLSAAARIHKKRLGVIGYTVRLPKELVTVLLP